LAPRLFASTRRTPLELAPWPVCFVATLIF